MFSGVLWRVLCKRVATMSRASSTRSLGGVRPMSYVQLIFASYIVTMFVLSYYELKHNNVKVYL